MDMTKLSPIFQQGNFVSKNPFGAAFLGKGFQQADNVLNQISNHMIDAENRQSDLDAATKAKEIRRDTYTKSDSSSLLEDISTELLEAALGFIRSDLYKSQRFEQGLTDFKEQLEQYDQVVQGYQDMLDGKIEMPDHLNRSAAELLHKSAQELREQFLQDNIEQYNSLKKNYMLEEERTAGAVSTVLEPQKYSKMDEPDWQIDASCSNIYTEVDRVLDLHQDVFKTYAETIHLIQNELYKRGETQYLPLEREEWLEWEPTISPERNISAQTIMEQLKKILEHE